MASDRLKAMQQEQNRRRTERGMQRSQMMNQRKQAANTAYMHRMAKHASGVSADTRNAMAFGESRGDFEDRKQRYLTNDAQRSLMDSQGYAVRTGADAQMRGADAEYLGVEQRPELQRSQIASDEKMEGMRQVGANARTKMEGDYGIRMGQLDHATAREQAQATRDASAHQIAVQRQMMLEQPIVTESGIVRRGKGGAYEMDAFENPSAYDEAEAAYQKAGALHKVWKDPLRALIPWYDPKINE